MENSLEQRVNELEKDSLKKAIAFEVFMIVLSCGGIIKYFLNKESGSLASVHFIILILSLYGIVENIIDLRQLNKN